MPTLDMKFSKIDIIVAKHNSPNIVTTTLEAFRCMLKLDSHFEVMRSPIGDEDWCAASRRSAS